MVRWAFASLWLVCAALAASSCIIDADFGGSTFLCEESPVCPSGFECVSGVCVTDTAIDGSIADASADAVLGPDAEPDAAVPRSPVRGNILDITFDDYAATSLIFDRSGNDFDGEREGPSPSTTSAFGGSLSFDGVNDYVVFADHPLMFSGNTITIEAWLRPDVLVADMAVYGDFDAGDTPNTEYQLSVSATGNIVFYTNDGCSGTSVSVTGSAATQLVALTSAFVAVVWDGSTVVFYKDGVVVDSQPLTVTPCEFSQIRRYRIGRRRDGLDPFDGRIDELKVSSYAKTAAEIAMSVAFDSTQVIGLCGDGIHEGNEECELANGCCLTATCQHAANGTPCGNGTPTCNGGGLCRQETPARTTMGLVALYEFNETVGATTVADTSGVGTPLTLTVLEPLNVTFGGGRVTINLATKIESLAGAAKVSNAMQATNELTVEAWITPANTTQDGPARIVTMSLTSGSRNFLLGQEDRAYIGRVRTGFSTSNGEPKVVSAEGDAITGLRHVVVTRSTNGKRRIYINGILRGSSVVLGDFASWNDTFDLVLANEKTLGRAWLGSIHLVALYDRALSSNEVETNYLAGN